MSDAPYGYHPGTKIPRRRPEAEHHGDERGTCKFCGEKDLVWEMQGTRWRLVTIGGTPHACANDPPKVTPFW